jgi:hypothetical protein
MSNMLNMSHGPELVDPGVMEQSELNDDDDVVSDAPNKLANQDPLGGSHAVAATDREIERELDVIALECHQTTWQMPERFNFGPDIDPFIGGYIDFGGVKKVLRAHSGKHQAMADRRQFLQRRSNLSYP